MEIKNPVGEKSVLYQIKSKNLMGMHLFFLHIKEWASLKIRQSYSSPETRDPASEKLKLTLIFILIT